MTLLFSYSCCLLTGQLKLQLFRFQLDTCIYGCKQNIITKSVNNYPVVTNAKFKIGPEMTKLQLIVLNNDSFKSI